MKLFEETRPATVENVSWLRKALGRELKSLRIQSDLANDLLLAVAEIATNAVVHAQRTPTEIGLRVDLIGASLRIVITDDGAPFHDFGRRWNEASRKDLAASGFDGLGLALANALLHHVVYAPGDRGEYNCFVGWRPLQRSRPTILILDDDTTLLRLYSFVLRSRYRILTATSVSMAHSLAKGQTVDLILSDYHLGGEFGTSLITALEKDAERIPIPVIMLSRDRTLQNRENQNGYCIELFLFKPVSPKTLTDAVEQALTRSRKRITGMFRYFGANVERLLLRPSDTDLLGLGVAHRSAVATAGGGDFLLHLKTAGNLNRFVVVDVMGHGLKAKAGAIALAAVLRAVNAMLPPDAGPGAFLTTLSSISHRDEALADVIATLAVIDSKGGSAFEISGAGHPAPAVVGPNGVRPIKTSGPMIGLFEAANYDVETIQLTNSERLVVVTDGIEPKFLASGGALPEGLVQRILENKHSPINDAADAVAEWVASQHGPSPRDDWTIILFEGREPTG